VLELSASKKKEEGHKSVLAVSLSTCRGGVEEVEFSHPEAFAAETRRMWGPSALKNRERKRKRWGDRHKAGRRPTRNCVFAVPWEKKRGPAEEKEPPIFGNHSQGIGNYKEPPHDLERGKRDLYCILSNSQKGLNTVDG